MANSGRVVALPLDRGDTDDSAPRAKGRGAGVLPPGRKLSAEPSGVVDDWGRDPGLVRRVMTASNVRWDVTTGGEGHLPRRSGALIVVNSRRFALTAVYAAFAISRAVDRPVRFVGRSDTAPLGALGRRLGGLLTHPDEVYSALHNRELVVMTAAASGQPRDVGIIDHALVRAAISAKVRIYPGATTSSPFNRHARVEIGTATKSHRTRRGPLLELELAERVGDDIRFLLDQMGDINTGTPLDLLPLSGLGGGR